MTLSRQCSSNCRLASKLPNSEDDTRQLKGWTQIVGPVSTLLCLAGVVGALL